MVSGRPISSLISSSTLLTRYIATAYISSHFIQAQADSSHHFISNEEASFFTPTADHSDMQMDHFSGPQPGTGYQEATHPT
jgi:hypothetical protein